MTGQQYWDLSSLNVRLIGCSAFSSFTDHAVGTFVLDALAIFFKAFYMFGSVYDDYSVPEQTVFLWFRSYCASMVHLLRRRLLLELKIREIAQSSCDDFISTDTLRIGEMLLARC